MKHHKQFESLLDATPILAAVFVLTAFLSTGTAIAANGNDVPHEAKGYQESGYSLSDHETINMANGNLTWRLPLYSLQTDGGLSYELALYYNSKVWYKYSYCTFGQSGYAVCPEPGIPVSANVADGVENYGFGWDLRPPRIYAPSDRFGDERNFFFYVDQAGGRHSLHVEPAWGGAGASNVRYTKDGTNLRVTFDDLTPDWTSATTAVMEDGQGTRYYFEQIVPTDCEVSDSDKPEITDTDLSGVNFRMEIAGLYLKRIERGPWFLVGGESIAANQIDFEYRGQSADELTDVCRPYGEEQWLIDKITAEGIDGDTGESSSRSLSLTYVGDSSTERSYLLSVNVPKFDPTLGEQETNSLVETIWVNMTDYEFGQTNGITVGDCTGGVLCFEAQTLSKVSYPNGAEFSFSPNGTGGHLKKPLGSVVLPSGATLEYEYGEWIIGAGKDSQLTANPCATPTLTPTAATYDSSGGIGQILIEPENEFCDWRATVSTGSSWITIDFPTIGRGTGQISYSVEANSGTERAGRVMVNSSVHDVLQEDPSGNQPDALAEPDSTDWFWVTCGTPTARPCHDPDPSIYCGQTFLHTGGITKRKISYQDAGGSRTTSTHFSNHLDCSTNQFFSAGGVWPYDFRFALEESWGTPYPEYLWTLAYTTDTETIVDETSKGVAEIHRFHPRTFEEFSVDHLAGDVGNLFWNAFLLDIWPEDYSFFKANFGIRRLRHSETERELKNGWGSIYPQDNGANLNYSYVKSSKSYSPLPSESSLIADVGNCYENFDPAFADPPPPSSDPWCPVVTTTQEVDKYLNQTLSHTSSAYFDFQVERRADTTYKTLNAELEWYLHRKRFEAVWEPGCDAENGCTSTNLEYLDLSSDPARPFYRIRREIVNPEFVDSVECNGDCVAHDYTYDGLGNLATNAVSGGYGVGVSSIVPTMRFVWKHGRQVERWLDSTGDSILLWKREADPNTGLFRWHLNGSGAGHAYLYNGVGKLTDIAPVYRDWDNNGDLRLQTLEDGTPLKGTHIQYAFPGQPESTSGLLENSLYDATWTNSEIVGSLAPGEWQPPAVPLRSSFVFDGLGRLTQTVERYPGAPPSQYRSRFSLDFLYDGTNSNGSSSCNMAQGWDLSYKTRVQIGSSWIDGTTWPSSGCADLSFHWTETQFDSLGRPVIVRQPDDSFLSNSYWGDSIVATARSVAVAYNGTHTPDDRTRVETLDGFGRLRRLEEQVTAGEYGFETAEYGYDHADRLTFVDLQATNGSQTRVFEYSPGGFLTWSKEPERWTEHSSYDAFGNLRIEETYTKVSPGDRTRTEYKFDDYSRPTEKLTGEVGSQLPLALFFFGDSSSQNVGRPNYNKLETAKQKNWFEEVGEPVSTTITHDWSYEGPGGRISARKTSIEEIGNADDGFVLGYSHDVWGNIAKVNHPSWSPWDLCDERRDVAQEFNFDGTWLTSVDLYHDGSQVAYSGANLIYHPNGRVYTTSFEASGSVVGDQMEARDPSGMARPGSMSFMWETQIPEVFDVKWSQQDYAYDGSGNVISFDVREGGSAPAINRAFTYDGHNRLTAFYVDQAEARTYGYDRFGNLTSLGDTVFVSDSETNRLTYIEGIQIPVNEWDARGNLEWIPALPAPSEQRAKEFDYSPEDRLMESRDTNPVSGGAVWRYAYDTNGERVVSWKNDGAGATQEAKISVRDESGAVLTDWLLRPGTSFTRDRDYSYAAGRMITQVDWGVESSTRRYAAGDHLGSTRFLLGIDDSGTVTSEELLEYFPFGSFRAGGPTSDTTHLFTGHERDQGDDSSQLDYMHARYYSPNLGRFLSVDPVGGTVGSSQSWNRYSYVKNNPLVLFDPNGREDRRTDVDRAITEDVDFMVAVAAITDNMDLDNPMLSERFEWGTVITDLGGGDYGTTGLTTDRSPTSIVFENLRSGPNGKAVTTDGEAAAATLHGHPAISGLLNPFDKSTRPQKYVGAKASDKDRKSLGDAAGLLVYIAVTDSMLIRYDPNAEGRKERKILTDKDYEDFLQRAQAALAAKSD